jgi:hypothetical protein
MNRREREARMQRRGVWLIVTGQPVQVWPEDIRAGDVPALAQQLRATARAFIDEDDEGALVPLGVLLAHGGSMDSERKPLELVKEPASQVRAEVERENALAALRRAAQLVGALRTCKHCPETLAVFSKGQQHIIVNAATGLDHEGECIGRQK